MVAAFSPPDFMVVEGTLVVHLAGAAPGPEWVSVECASKEAYGCEELAEKMLEGLTLYVRRLARAHLNSSLSIGLTDAAVRSIQSEFGIPPEFQGVDECMPHVEGSIKVANQQVLILVIVRIWNHGQSVYYIVYDAKDASLYMIPSIPPRLELMYTVMPVPARPAGCRGQELVLAARTLWPQSGGAEEGRLCVCTPATRAKDSPDPWAMKVHCFQELPPAFSADVVFSLEDRVFWADLSKGVACTDLRQGGSVVDTVFISLPDGYQIDFSKFRDVEIDAVKMSRTVGCVEGSIKFVCINPGVIRAPGSEIVKVWTLDLDHRRWKEDEELTCSWKELWMQACSMNARLRDMPQPLEPQYPILMPDGALCLVLPKTRHKRWGPRVKRPDYICSFDMFSKSCLFFGQVCSYHVIDPVILPYNFFKDCYPAPKRKPSTHKRKLPS